MSISNDSSNKVFCFVLFFKKANGNMPHFCFSFLLEFKSLLFSEKSSFKESPCFSACRCVIQVSTQSVCVLLESEM